MEHIVLRYEIIINKSKKETKSNGNIWYKLSKNMLYLNGCSRKKEELL